MVQEILSVASSALRRLGFSATLFVALIVIHAQAVAAGVSLAWDRVNSPSVVGYMLYYGPAAGNYPNKIDVGNVITYTVPTLAEGSTYHFAVTAYDASRTESPFSNDVGTTIPYSVPVANFTASSTSGPAPLALNFVNTSTGTITSYLWTFGDGTTSTVGNPAKVYSTPGVYTVSLKVTGPGGTNTKTVANYITVTASSDTTPPTVPASLSATTSGSSTINLAWTASTDNVGVASYRIERCQGASCVNFVQIASVAGTSYSNTGLTASTAYRYRVRAGDAAGNLSGYSSIATATTAAAADTTPPTVPASLSATASGSSTINLAWTASTDNVGVASYRIEQCQGTSCVNFTQIASVAGTSYSNTGLTASTAYRYRVRAADAAGNLSGYSSIATATTAAAADTTSPTVPASLSATASGSRTINLSWAASTDNVGVASYRIEQCQGTSCVNFTQIASVAGTSYSNTGLAASTAYRYRVRAADAAGNLSGYSSIATATTAAAADTTPPTVPLWLSVAASNSSTINLTWAVSTDNVGVANYRIERCQGASCVNFVQIASVAGTTYSNVGLAAATTYRYRIRAVDAAGNLSGYSSMVAVTTKAAAAAAAAAIGFVQLGYSTPQTPQQTVAITFSKTQTAGNLNVVVVGWNDTTASVQSVTDTGGNVYTRAVGPTSIPGQLTQSIYYAKNIVAAAGANTVTVTFSAAAVYPDVRIVEYTGIDKVNPIDVVAAKTGTDSNSTSGAVTTTYANDLLFSANTVNTVTASAAAGYTARVITSPDGDIVQDRVVTATGSQTASAPLSPAGSWVMQLIAFRGN